MRLPAVVLVFLTAFTLLCSACAKAPATPKTPREKLSQRAEKIITGAREDPLPNYADLTCEEFVELAQNDPDKRTLLLVWAHGYHSGINGLDLDARPLTRGGVRKIQTAIVSACEKDGKNSYVNTVSKLTTSAVKVRVAEEKESKALNMKIFPCGEFLEVTEKDENITAMLMVWGHGYHGGLHGLDLRKYPMNRKGVNRLMDNVIGVCKKNNDKIFTVAVHEVE